MDPTLPYLATGIDFSEMHNSWKVSFSTVGKVVIKICEAIIALLQDEVLKKPVQMNEEKWLSSLNSDGSCLIA